MASLTDRIKHLINEIQKFPLGECSPSDDPDKQSAYVYAFLDLARRFVGSAKRIDSELLVIELNKIDLDIQVITEAYELKAELLNVSDLIEDLSDDPNSKLEAKITISPATANELLKIITNNLVSESANNLPLISVGYGLKEGDISEAFVSKKNYIHSRTCHLSPAEILSIAEKMAYKYPNTELEVILSNIRDSNERLNVISKFDDIKSLLTNELTKAKFTIWVAVAWFTDKDLANLLYKKSKEGLNIQIIINGDKINSKLSTKLSSYFETYLVPESNRKLMHNKFCVIDLNRVIHGSYNWTNKAQYNNETVSLIENRAVAVDFANQFVKLKKELKFPN
ncbi:phospholipase D-like domain-containing protein [Marinicellulosiphila megalodicopiae]|uniref:phospholipase D-like domain-containing protein n=1 Tax=Marinicellulosiphila megalodicopiae TaxID=2724896 RepID=UPI003BAE5D1C